MTEVPEEYALGDSPVGREGRLLVRMHTYRERDRNFVRQVREVYRRRLDGKLLCETCGWNPTDLYGEHADRAIEAHHKIPIAQLQPDSDTRVEDIAMVCANCHRVIHRKNPCLTIDEMHQLIAINRINT